MAGYRGFDIERDVNNRYYELFERGNRHSITSSKSLAVIKRKVDAIIKQQIAELRKGAIGKTLMSGGAIRAIVDAAVEGAQAEGKIVTLNTIGEAAYLKAIQRAKFNSWTGNLENSYLVQVVNNGNIVKNFYNRNPKFVPRYTSKKGNKYVFLLKKRHNVSKSKKAHIFYHVKERKYARILEDFEAKRGYIIGAKSGAHLSGNISLATLSGGAKFTQAKSGIVIRNMAPYAERVEHLHGYRVLPYGSEKRLVGDGTQLIQLTIKKELDRIIKKHKL